VDTISKPLSFHTVEISKFNILIVRDKEGEINAFYNSCSHRGSILKKEKSGKLKSNLLICPYHQWSYNASNGNLVRTTSIIDPKNFRKDENCLIKVKIKVWNGLVFINMNKNAKWNAKKVFPDYSDAFSQLNVSDYQIGHTWKKKIKCNWKIFWENYSECLHCPNLHPELSDLVPIYGRRLVDIKDDPNWKRFTHHDDPKYKGGMKKGTETWSMNGSAQGHRVEYLENQTDFPGYIYMTTWPSMFLAIFTDHIRMVRILPLSEELTEVTAEWVFRKETLKDKKYSMKNVVDFAVLVMKQDAEACELNQKGIHNPTRKNGTLMPEEYEIKRFHSWLRKKL
jgi:Rieske 2Fe-2S family protein